MAFQRVDPDCEHVEEYVTASTQNNVKRIVELATLLQV